SIDYFYMKKMYKETLEQVSELERATGPDAHLNTLRAGVLAQLGNVQPGRDELKTALELEPDLAEAVNLAIALDLAARDEAGALAKITDARKRNVALGTVSQNPDYVAFMAKPDTKKKLAAPEAAPNDEKKP
ncbi:MAG TPA: hypothetical protein VMS65_05930, partial [Polyangiaceae bacterium]|nr:hypothetical protein [Polyangiaceae bacterium]